MASYAGGALSCSDLLPSCWSLDCSIWSKLCVGTCSSSALLSVAMILGVSVDWEYSPVESQFATCGYVGDHATLDWGTVFEGEKVDIEWDWGTSNVSTKRFGDVCNLLARRRRRFMKNIRNHIAARSTTAMVDMSAWKDWDWLKLHTSTNNSTCDWTCKTCVLFIATRAATRSAARSATITRAAATTTTCSIARGGDANLYTINKAEYGQCLSRWIIRCGWSDPRICINITASFSRCGCDRVVLKNKWN